ncbi:hypothetical protein RIF29_19386 [Crotalaria pallida]|uniref:Uncharacterized protein n=1 Tax=Crotalaria pallida TaxID=3830 RepID=A0AAN9F167_CROPI
MFVSNNSFISEFVEFFIRSMSLLCHEDFIDNASSLKTQLNQQKSVVDNLVSNTWATIVISLLSSVHHCSPLSRQDLVSWKMALEKRQLPEAERKVA